MHPTYFSLVREDLNELCKHRTNEVFKILTENYYFYRAQIWTSSQSRRPRTKIYALITDRCRIAHVEHKNSSFRVLQGSSAPQNNRQGDSSLGSTYCPVELRTVHVYANYLSSLNRLSR
jgi:hypothetical protein